MILAGGQGKRLSGLTKDNSKPAIPFAGKYKIIDFTLTNCAHSNLNIIGILTQYQPLKLNSHIGNGSPWGYNSNSDGIFVLPPHSSHDSCEWYKGTANAIYQNMNFIDQYNPKYVVILSGDHVYKMDYSKLIDFHKQKGGAATIATISVPTADAHRFGIIEANNFNEITNFVEKPNIPRSNLASMGVYVFTTEILKRYLMLDENNTHSKHDFGKNIIPAMMQNNERLYAYNFDGYWKDVGTINSYYEANMDALNPDSQLNIDDENWKIYTRTEARIPQIIYKNAKVNNSFVTENTTVRGIVENSIVSPYVSIEPDVVIKNSIIHNNVIIEKGCIIEDSIISEGAHIGKNCHIGNTFVETPEFYDEYIDNGLTLVSPNVFICDDVVIGKNSVVSNDITNMPNDIGGVAIDKTSTRSSNVC
jgi:glucose-1-phosphate adenylyltransferase